MRAAYTEFMGPCYILLSGVNREEAWNKYTLDLQYTTYCSTWRHYRICCFGLGCCGQGLTAKGAGPV